MGLLLGGAVLGTSGYLMYRDLLSNQIEINKEKKKLEKKFNTLLDAVKTKMENELDHRYKILNYIPQDYGCDTVISLPYGKTLQDFHKILPQLKYILQANIIAELTTSKRCIYMRIHYKNREIEEKWNVRIKWYELMFNLSGSSDFRNKDYETFMIKEVKEEIYGFKMIISVPVGLKHDAILNNISEINNAFKCNVWGEYVREKSQIVLTIIKNEIPDDYKYVPVKTKANEFYIGMTYDYQKIIVPLEDYCHGMYSGMTGMGKTVAILMACVNLIYWHTPLAVEFYFCQISAKQDLNIFRKVKHCKYYADNVANLLKMLRYLNRVMKHRNSMLFSGKDYFESIYKWNEKHSNKFSEIYYIGDEAAMLQPSASDDPITDSNKKKCLALLTTLYQQGRSAGIHVFNSLQRPSKDSFDAPMKAQIGLKIVLKQPNIASSLVVLDDSSATELKKREAIVEFDKRYLMKTLYLDKEMILKYTEKWQLEKGEYLNLDDNGNIIEKKLKEEVVEEIKEETNQDLIEIEFPKKVKKRTEEYFSRPRRDGKK